MAGWRDRGSSKARERAQLLLDEIGLRERGHHYPSQLSGGEQQRVAIARALIMKPKFIFADEPTGNLDTMNAAKVMEILMRINKQSNTTLVLVTHEPEFSRKADREIYLVDGRISNR